MPDTRPNVLLVCSDQQRPDWVGWNESAPVETPALTRLARRGVHFENAVCPSPVCNPSRSCLASGMEYDRCGVPNNEVDYHPARGTLYRRLRDAAGYHVAGVGKFDLTAAYGFGDDGGTGIEPWGFSTATFTPAKNETVARVQARGGPSDPYTHFLAEEGLLEEHVRDYERRNATEGGLEEGKLLATFPTSLPESARYDAFLRRAAERHLREMPADRPWFLQVNFQDPHDPWDAAEALLERVRDREDEVPDPAGGPGSVAQDTHRAVRRNYAAMVEHLDDCLGSLLETLAETGQREKTIVVYLSDHGEMLGDHGQWKKDSPLQASMGVPMVVAGPGIESRPPEPAPATILDLHATVLEWAGLDPGDVDSQSMRPYLSGTASEPPRDVVYSGISTWRAVYDGRYELIRGYDPALRTGARYEPRGVEPGEVTLRLADRAPILYDLAGPGEPTDVADENPDVVDRLSDRLREIRGTPTTFSG